MEITYCNKWSLKKRCDIGVLSVKEACQKHINNESYTVVIKENRKIKYVIDIANRFIITRFMNDGIIPYLIYEFHVKGENNIFLKLASYYEYDSSNNKIEYILFNFNEDGKVSMERRNLESEEVEEREGEYEIEGNWSKYPEFGEYHDLIRAERGY